MTKSRGILLARRQWTPTEDALLMARYPDATARDTWAPLPRGTT